jgi:DNA methylase.
MKNDSLQKLAEKLNSLSVDSFWDVGKFLVEKVLPYAKEQKLSEEELYKHLSAYPGFKFPSSLLKQCHLYFSYYPDVKKRKLPENFYFELASKVPDSYRRAEYEKLALQNKWTISELKKRIRQDSLIEKENERTKFGFDLKNTDIWAFEVPDPRFGKAGYRGRLAGQIVANAIYHFTEPGSYIVDPFAGSGTLGDVIEKIPIFGDRRYKMYDNEPSDGRIVQNNIFLSGIPEESSSVDYVFLDFPEEFYSSIENVDVALSNFRAKVKTTLRETKRILKVGGRASVVVNTDIGDEGVVDYPFEVKKMFIDVNFKNVANVYLPERSNKKFNYFERKPLISEMRQLLTFEKLPETRID